MVIEEQKKGFFKRNWDLIISTIIFAIALFFYIALVTCSGGLECIAWGFPLVLLIPVILIFTLISLIRNLTNTQTTSKIRWVIILVYGIPAMILFLFFIFNLIRLKFIGV